ncbi:MAG: protein kinase [Acidobacteria bacterium]|nr:protein kinase [Acidobacteriota bacterium]
MTIPNPLQPTHVLPGPSDSGHDAFEGRTVGSYRITGFIGAGGQARVYRAQDERLDREVALKILSHSDPDAATRMAREAKSMARVRHPNVCPVYETGMVDGHMYIAMELIPGLPLSQVSDELTNREKAVVFQQVADGLAAAHLHGLVHRDVKPGNILVERSDRLLRAVLTDFGLARLQGEAGVTLTGEVMGTPAYMSPEQARGEFNRLDGRSDVYSLGAAMYTVMTGKAPFDGSNPIEMIFKVLNQEPTLLRVTNARVHPDLETIVMKCLEKEPERRYTSARELADDLRRFLDGEAIHARPHGPVYRLWRRLRKKRALLFTVFASALVILGLAAWAMLAVRFSREQARHAAAFEQEVRYLSERMRYARTAPLHDLRAEEAWFKQRCAHLEDRIRRAGPAALGPGHAALGRCALIRGDDHEAVRLLRIARDRDGYRPPETAYALGSALVSLYRREMRALESVGPAKRWVRAALVALRHRSQALDLIEEGREATSEPSELVEAQVLFLQDRSGEALEALDRLQRRAPWVYEGRVLAGTILTTEAIRLADRGEIGPAREAFRRAIRSMEEAGAVGRSDPDVFVALTRTLAMAGQLEARYYIEAPAMDSHYRQGIDAASRALATRPDSLDALLALGELYTMAAEIFYFDLRKDLNLEPTLGVVNRILRLKPRSADAHRMAGTLYQLQANRLARTGVDPGAPFRMALGHLEESRRINPDNPAVHLQIGLLQFARIGRARQTGENPLPFLETAAESLRRAVSLAPSDPFILFRAGNVLSQLARHRMAVGTPLGSELGEAIQALTLARRLNPALEDAVLVLIQCELMRDALEEAAGIDDTAALRRVQSIIDDARKRTRERLFLRPQQAEVYLRQARRQGARGMSPEEGLAKTEACIAELEKDPAYDVRNFLYFRWKVALVRAMHRLRAGRFDEAVKVLDRVPPPPASQPFQMEDRKLYFCLLAWRVAARVGPGRPAGPERAAAGRLLDGIRGIPYLERIADAFGATLALLDARSDGSASVAPLEERFRATLAGQPGLAWALRPLLDWDHLFPARR